jgi:hypothetical protein
MFTIGENRVSDVSFKFIVKSISEGAQFAPNLDQPRKLIVNFLKIPFHFCEDYRIFREGEYQVKNYGYAIDKQWFANIPDVGKKQQRLIKRSHNANDEHQQEKKYGKAINSAKAIDLSIMALGRNELIELDLAFGRNLAYGHNMAVGRNELIKLILVAIGRIELIIEFILARVCSFGSASFFIWPSLQMTKYCVMRECENILNGYIYVCDYIFSHQDGIYGFKFPSRFLGISRRDLTFLSLN